MFFNNLSAVTQAPIHTLYIIHFKANNVIILPTLMPKILLNRVLRLNNPQLKYDIDKSDTKKNEGGGETYPYNPSTTV